MSDLNKNSFELKSAKTVAWLHGLAFAIFSVCNIFIAVFFYPWLESVLPSHWHEIFKQLVAFAIDLGLYSGIYFVCRTVYFAYKFKKISPEMNLDGEWFHVHIPTVLDEQTKENKIFERDFLRAGNVMIKQDMYAMVVMGVNYKAIESQKNEKKFKWQKDLEVKTEWEYKTSSFAEDEHGSKQMKIYACYQAISSNTNEYRGNKINANRLGVHDLTIINEDKIEGDYLDTYPSNNKGKVYFFRKEEDRDAVIKQYFEKTLEV